MAQSTELLNRRILVIEDDFLVAQALCAVLQDAGARVVGPVGWADEALRLVDAETDPVDGAVLDVSLHGERSYAVADVLKRHHIPFVFATGYGSGGLEPGYRDIPRYEKPFDPRVLIRALASK